MAVVNKIQKVGHLDLWDIVKFQIHLHCHMKQINLSESDLESLTLLAINGEAELTSFCNAACIADERDRDPDLSFEREIFKTPQSVRNSINKLENIGLIVKRGKSKKRITVNPEMNIQAKGNIFVEVKFLRKDESQEA